MEALCYAQADQLIEAKGLVIDKDGRRTLAQAVGAALQRASLTLERFVLGDVGEEAPPVRPRFTASLPAAKASPSKVAFDEFVKGWAAERKPAEKTLYDWKRVMVQLINRANGRVIVKPRCLVMKAAALGAFLEGAGRGRRSGSDAIVVA